MFSIKKIKTRISIPVAVVALVAISLLYSFCKRSEKDEVIMQMVVQLTEMQHFSPAAMDDDFSEKVYKAYLKALDPSKQFLTQEDIKQLDVYKLQIDDQIRNGSFQIYELANSLMAKRTNEVQGYYRETLAQPFDFTLKETVELDPDKLGWAANSAELKDRWIKSVKYNTLSRFAELQKSREKETDETKKKSDADLEADARQRILKLYNDNFNYNNQQNDEDRFSTYMNAITAAFDPHTQYQTPENKETFDIRLSGQFEGIGATLQTSEGYAKIVDIVPGSASWKQGELKVNDLITKVKQENEAEPVDIYGMRLNDAVKLIRGKKGTKVTLTVKRVDGSIHNITITRDVVIVEETYAKSAVLSDPTTKQNVGYIYLPSFYVDFKNTPTGRACSDDVAKEIVKLKKENISGIILDLRSNTGGSLTDAIKMGGLFISSGPIVQVKSNVGNPRVYSDTDPNIQYDGPLVILTDALSASASEILAAAMQDYKRAVIIGGPSTFGKGTVQVVAGLDDYIPRNLTQLKPLGSLVLTIQKYYRINGGSTQLKGVTSDIVLPDAYSVFDIGERFEDNCLPWTTVNPAKYQTWSKPVPVDKLKEKSVQRTSKNEGFKLMAEQVAFTKARKNETQVSLNINDFRNEEKKRTEENKRFDEISKLSTSLKISTLAADKEAMKGDTAKISRMDKWISSLSKDIYLEEAVHVVGDMK